MCRELLRSSSTDYDRLFVSLCYVRSPPGSTMNTSQVKPAGVWNTSLALANTSLALANTSLALPNTSLALPNTTQLSLNTTTDELYGVPTGLVILLSMLYGSISVISVIGNALVIIVVAKNKSMHTVTNFFIANLSVADVMISIFSVPFQFQAALLQRWNLPHFLCPVAPFVKELSVNVSIITLAVISLDRYFAVIHPLKPRCSRRRAKTVMAVVWLFSLVSGIPPAIVSHVVDTKQASGGTKPFCMPTYPEVLGINLGRVYIIYLSIVQYFLPLIIISYAYGRITHKVWLSKAPGSAVDTRDQMLNRNKRRVSTVYINPLDMKGCICHFTKWQIHPFISDILLIGVAHIHLSQ